MVKLKEQHAQFTSSQASQSQQVPDDPLAPKPIRFTHQRDDEVFRKQRVNGQTLGWHLEDDAEGSDAASQPSPRGQGQASTSSRQTRDYQQGRVTQAYPLTTRMPTSWIPACHVVVSATSILCHISTVDRLYCPLPQSTCAASVSPAMLPINSTVLLHDAVSTGRRTW